MKSFQEFNPTASFTSLSNVPVLKGVVTSRSWLTADISDGRGTPRPPSPQVLELSVVKRRFKNHFLLHQLFP